MKHRLLQMLIAIDQLFNAIFAGWADETLSSRAYRCGKQNITPKKRWLFAYHLINLMFFSKAHCEIAYKSEQRRKHLPPAMRPDIN